MTTAGWSHNRRKRNKDGSEEGTHCLTLWPGGSVQVSLRLLYLPCGPPRPPNRQQFYAVIHRSHTGCGCREATP